MKKTMIILVSLVACVGLASTLQGVAYSKIGETLGTTVTTNYLGFAKTTQGSPATPSINSAVWKIIRTVKDADGNVTEIKNAYGSGDGDNALWSTAWTNRVGATYK